jgi:hypothetical protein
MLVFPLNNPIRECRMEKFGAYARILVSASCAFLLLLLVAPAGRADGVSFSSSTGDWGSATHTFTLHGISITATAFNGGNLFGKRSGSDETGVGLAGDPSGDHEIFQKMSGAQDYIQLDLLGLITGGFNNIEFQMGSTEDGEWWQATACATAGVSGSGPCSANAATLVGSDEALNRAPVNLNATDHFLDISAKKGNVLLDDLQAFDPPSVAEPSSNALLLVGILALAGVSVARRLAAQKA